MKKFLKIFFLLHLLICQNIWASYESEESEERNVQVFNVLAEGSCSPMKLRFEDSCDETTEIEEKKEVSSPENKKRKRLESNKSWSVSKRSEKTFSDDSTETQEENLNFYTSIDMPPPEEKFPTSNTNAEYIPPKPSENNLVWNHIEPENVKKKGKKAGGEHGSFGSPWTKSTEAHLLKLLEAYVIEKKLPPLNIRKECTEKMNEKFGEQGFFFTTGRITQKLNKLFKNTPLQNNQLLKKPKKSIPQTKENKRRPRSPHCPTEAEKYLLTLLAEGKLTIFSKNINADFYRYLASELEMKFPDHSFKESTVRYYVKRMREASSQNNNSSQKDLL